MVITVLCLAAVGWWYISTQEPSGQPIMTSSPTLTHGAELTKDRNPPTISNSHTTAATTVPKEHQSNPEDDWEADWLEQMHTRRYSEDITVELTSLGLEFESCGNRDLSWRFKDQTLSAQQTVIRTAVEAHCDELLKAYPLLEDSRVKQSFRLMFERFPANTPLGKFFARQADPEQRVSHKTFFSDLIPLALQAKNSQVLVMADWFGSNMPHELALETTLQSKNIPYIKNIRSLALNSLSCQFQAGLTCSPTGRFMQDKCFSDERFCGMDFTTWYEHSIPAGMQQDVTLIKQYFQGLVQP